MDTTASRLAEIARRYEAGRRDRAPINIVTLRIAELRRLFAARYGRQLPDDDSGRDDALIMAHHLARCRDPERRIASFLQLQAPWMDQHGVQKLIAKVIAKPLRWRADKLAVRLNLYEADRRKLGITTIGACDVPKAERLARRRRRKRDRKEEHRRAQGAKPRTEYEAQSLTRNKPWEAVGMSRASWYRAGKPRP